MFTIGDVLAHKMARQLANRPKRKVFMRDIEAYDRRVGSSMVRLLEMRVDSCVNHNVALSLQFWRDVTLYGVSEAYAYLVRYAKNGDALVEKLPAVKETVDEILAKIGQ